jgi:hypothetical protein
LHTTVNDIFSREKFLNNSLEDERYLSCPRLRKKRLNPSVELPALLDQYSEFPFDGIPMGDGSLFCYLTESELTSAQYRIEVTPRVRPEFSIEKLRITVFSIDRIPCPRCASKRTEREARLLCPKYSTIIAS